MPFPMKIQPIDFSVSDDSIGISFPKAPNRSEISKPVVKSRLKRLFERQFPNVLRASSASEKSGNVAGAEPQTAAGESEPSSVCLANMVQNFIEDNTEKPPAAVAGGMKIGRNCSDFDGECDFADSPLGAAGDACEILKSLIPCASVSERNLLADTARIFERNKTSKSKEDCRRIVTDGLSSLGYDASICKSRWEKSPSFPSGEYEYIDVMVDGERFLVDIDFRSEFEIARSTGNYKAILQSLPAIFVGKSDRLQHIVALVSEAAKQSLKKKGLHIPPWRKPEYMRAKWLAPYQRLSSSKDEPSNKSASCEIKTQNFSGEFELIFGGSALDESPPPADSGEDEKIKVVVSPWKPPAVKPKVPQKGAKIVTGLASVLREKS